MSFLDEAFARRLPRLPPSRGRFGLEQSAASTAATVASTVASAASKLPPGILPSASEMASVFENAPALSGTITSASEAVSQGDTIMSTATDAVGLTGSLASGVSTATSLGLGAVSNEVFGAAIAGAAQALVSGLGPGPAADMVEDAAAAATVGGDLGSAIGSVFLPVIGGTLGYAAGAEIGAEIGLIAGAFPALYEDHFNVLKLLGQLTASGAGKGAAVGAAAGSVVPVVGTGIGALVGGLIGAFSSTPAAPPQGDYRYLAEKVCFPAIAVIPGGGSQNDAGYFGIVPGELNANPRVFPNSTFYVTQSGPNAKPSSIGPLLNYAPGFSFLVSWRSPAKSTSASRYGAWLLAQYYCRPFSTRLGHSTASAVPWDAVVAQFVKVYGQVQGPLRAAQALQNMHLWYGDPATFDTSLPFAVWAGNGHYHPGDGHVPNGVGIANDTAGAEVMHQMFVMHPLDGLYYPVGVAHDFSAQTMRPCSTANQTDVFLTPDTTALTVAEGAFLGLSTVSMFHLLVQLSHYWMKSRRADARVFPGLDTRNHPNFSRCLGLLSALLRKSMPAVSAVTVAVTPATAAAKPRTAAAVGADAPAPPPALGTATPAGEWNVRFFFPAFLFLLGGAAVLTTGRRSTVKPQDR